MDSFYIVGGNQLNGEVVIGCAKNSILPILAACILVQDDVYLENVPKYSDVIAMTKILSHLGAKIEWKGDDLLLNCKNICLCDVPDELACVVRSSIFTLGPISARLGKAKVAYPGGCDIGIRPIDIHLSGLRHFGCKIIEKNGYIYSDASKLKCADFMLPFASVGATENIMMLASLTDGESRIYNPAKEPEIVDLACFLNACGADISGQGGNVIAINGVKKLHGTKYKAISDRIEAGTFMIATAMCGGEVILKNADINHNQSLICKLRKTTCQIEGDSDNIIVKSHNRPLSFGEVETEIYPGFPTDLQAPICSLASICDGYSIIIENLFESRFKHVGELLKMGCDIRIKNGVAFIRGKEKIFGASVSATDLRGGASLVLAGLVADGYTTVDNIKYIDRGYYNFEDKLSSLGANIKRIKCEKKVDNC